MRVGNPIHVTQLGSNSGPVLADNEVQGGTAVRAVDVRV